MSWTAGAAGIPSGSEALWGRLYTEEPPPDRGAAQGVREEAEASRAPSSKRERGGGSRSSHLSQELDVKPGGERKYAELNFSVCTFPFTSDVGFNLCVCVHTVPSSSVQQPCREQ